MPSLSHSYKNTIQEHEDGPSADQGGDSDPGKLDKGKIRFGCGMDMATGYVIVKLGVWSTSTDVTITRIPQMNLLRTKVTL